MIYLVSNNTNLFTPDKYLPISFEKSFNLLDTLKLIQIDSETSGLDCHTKDILTLQLGNKDNQVVFDWFSLKENNLIQLKNLLENSKKQYLGWNLL